jgi:DNA-binding transcriptional regulator YiaG
MIRSVPNAGMNELRGVRLRLRLSQSKFAMLLGVSEETYRTWDSGRRLVSHEWLDKARAVAATNDPNRLWSLQELATELGVHVRTLRDAARTGRLDVLYENRVVFRNPVARATLAAGRRVMERYDRRSYSRFAARPPVPQWPSVPSDWNRRLVRIRRELRLTQTRFAEQIGAAGKSSRLPMGIPKAKTVPSLLDTDRSPHRITLEYCGFKSWARSRQYRLSAAVCWRRFERT